MPTARSTVKLPKGGLTPEQISQALREVLAADGNQEAFRTHAKFDDGHLVNFGHSKIQGAPCQILVVPSKERDFFTPRELARKAVVVSHGDKSVLSYPKQNEIINYVIEFAGKLEEACRQLSSDDTRGRDEDPAESLD